MIKLPYFNSGFIDLLPNSKGTTQYDGYIQGAGDTTKFDLSNYSKVYITFDGKNPDDYNWNTKPAFNFSNTTFWFEYKWIGGQDISPYNNKEWHRFKCCIEKTEEGCNVTVKTNEYEVTKTLKGSSFLSFSLGDRWYIKNVYISEADDELPYYVTSKVMTIDSIDNWKLNNAGEYVLTEVGEDGVIHLNQEILDTILRDYDIIGCAVSFNTEQRGENLKAIEFQADGETSTVQIDHGINFNYIPISFESPSNMEHSSLTVRG